MPKIVFGYMSAESFHANADGKFELGYAQSTVVSKRRREYDGEAPMVRVAITEVPPNLMDKLWDELSPDEKEFIAPPYKADVPDLAQLEIMAKHFSKQAERLESVSCKLALLIAEAKKM